MSDLNSLEDLKDAVIPEAASIDAPVREPKRDALGRSYATGKRKDAVARVWIKPGSGKVTVNGKEMNAYFARPVLQMLIGQAFSVCGVAGEFDAIHTIERALRVLDGEGLELRDARLRQRRPDRQV